MQKYGAYQVRVSRESEEPAWDSFLEATPGGRHTQTSLWARVRALVGWQAVRVVVFEGDRVVAGAQAFLRPLPLGGSLAYVPWGPVLGRDDPALARLVLDQLQRVGRGESVRYLAVRPPKDYRGLGEQLPRSGFQRSLVDIRAEPTATAIIDLRGSPEELLARMDSNTRYNIGHSSRMGIRVRQGTEADLPTFYRLLLATGRRRGFSDYGEDYYSAVWRLFHPRGWAQLFLAEYEGEPLSAVFALAFGDTVKYWRSAWSGGHSRRHPNEAAQWAAIQWARGRGYRYYDLEGIDADVAETAARGAPRPRDGDRGVTFYKMGFGGEIVFWPGLYDYVPNPLLRWAYSALFSRVVSQPVTARVIGTLRGVGPGRRRAA